MLFFGKRVFNLPNYLTEGHSEIERNWNRVCVAEVQIEHMTGKAAIEIINNKA